MAGYNDDDDPDPFKLFYDLFMDEASGDPHDQFMNDMAMKRIAELHEKFSAESKVNPKRFMLRVYGIAEEKEEDPRLRIITYFERLNMGVPSDEIGECIRGEQNLGTFPKPIIVTLLNEGAYNKIITRKSTFVQYQLIVVEELYSEKFEVLRAARKAFGHNKVSKKDDAIIVNTAENETKKFYFLEDFEMFMKDKEQEQ